MRIIKNTKVWAFIVGIWKDPVWSKVISAAIILASATLWAKYSNYSILEIYNFCLLGLTFQIPVYLIASLIGLIFIIRLLTKYFKKKPDPIWDEKIGNYAFKELYSILQGQNLPAQTKGMLYSGQKPPEDDLLILFLSSLIFLNKGIGISDNLDDGGYIYGVLAPYLVSYGLVDKVDEKHEGGDTYPKYQTSDLGHKFFALVERSGLKVPKQKTDETKKR